ncbi:MAG: hypothetical protein PHU31_04750 [Anaerotignum sp.]|nr:hypothetical protein [Anaerotignum sp.]
MGKFQTLLAPLKRKLFLEGFLQSLVKFWLAASVVGLAVVLLSKIIFIPDAVKLVLGAFGIAFLFAVGFTVIKRPKLQETAAAADALGGQERMITALELLQKQEPSKMEKMAIEDGIAVGGKVDFAKAYQLRLPKKLFLWMLLLIILTMATGFLPSPREEKAELYAKAKLEQVEKVIKDVQKEESLSAEEKKLLQKEMKKLSKELKRVASKEDGEAAVQKEQQELKKLEKDSVSKDLKQLAEDFAKQELTAPLAVAAEQGDAKAIEEAMAKLQEQLQQLTKEQLAALGKQMGAAAAQMSNEDLAKALEQLSEAMENGTVSAELLDQLSEQMVAQSAQNAELREALQNANQALGDANAQTPQAGQGEGQGQGQGEGQGQGQGAGQGAGGAGGSGNGRGSGHIDGEEIFTRNAADKADYDTQVNGTKNEGGDTSLTEQKMIGDEGERLPYEQVFHSYQNDAMKALEEQDTPYGMRQLVSDYFSTLEK